VIPPADPNRDLEDPILAMSGVGKEIWKGMDLDEFVRGLRRDPDDPLVNVPPPRTEKDRKT
jgi:hypothetical protein